MSENIKYKAINLINDDIIENSYIIDNSTAIIIHLQNKSIKNEYIIGINEDSDCMIYKTKDMNEITMFTPCNKDSFLAYICRTISNTINNIKNKIDISSTIEIKYNTTDISKNNILNKLSD